MAGASDFLSALAEAAAAAELEERAYRDSYYRRLAALERARVFAHRRADLLAKVARAIASLSPDGDVRAAATTVLHEEVGLLPGNEGHRIVIERFHEVTEAIAGLHKGEEADALDALRDFEDWHRARGGEFFALFDVYMPETPRVDF